MLSPIDALGFSAEYGSWNTIWMLRRAWAGRRSAASGSPSNTMRPPSGSITFNGREIADIKRSELKSLRREMQMIFQDPYSSLNPRKTVGTIISDPFVIHGINQTKAERKTAVQSLMDTVGLNPEHYNRYPHELSLIHI